MNTKKLNEKNRNAVIGTAFFVFLLLVFCAAFFYLHLKQCVSGKFSLDLWESDMDAYMLEASGEDSGFVFAYPLLFKLGAFFELFLNDYTAMAAATTLLHALAMLTAYYCMRKAVLRGEESLGREITVSAVTAALFMVSMVFDPRRMMYPLLLGVGSPNTYHNATSIAASPFAIAVFFLYCDMLRNDGGRIERRKAIALAVLLFLCCMAKPSYPLVFLAAAGLTEAFRLIKYKFRNIKEAVTLLLCVLPAMLYMLYQKSVMFGGEAGGIGFGYAEVWKAYKQFQKSVPLSLLKVTVFPLTVLAFNFRKLKDSFLYRFSWFQFAVSAFSYFFLYESGIRKQNGNFMWGYDYGQFLLFAASGVILLKSDDEKWKKGVQWAAFALHLLCGILYFGKVLLGSTYM